MALTPEQFARLTNKLSSFKEPPVVETKNKSLVDNLASAFKTRVGNIQESQTKANIGQISPVTAGITKIGQGAGFIGDIAGEAIMGVGKALLPKRAEEAVASGASAIFGSKPVQEVATQYQQLKQRYPEAIENLESIVNIGSLIPIGAGAKATGNIATKATGAVADAIVDTTSDIAKGVSNSMEVFNPAIQAVRNVPSRIATNVENVKKTEQVIKQLPQPAQLAVRNGVDIDDVKSVLEINKQQKPALAKLYDITKKFVDGKTKQNPIEAVGKPVITRLNTLKGQVSQLGTKLDEVANGLKGKAVKDYNALVSTVDDSLSKLGVSQRDEGLDFVGSNLEGLGSNEKIISNVYNRLRSANDASDLHRLKKYIDNNVSFGKTSGGFTGEAESLLKNWRSTIDKALDTSFPVYNRVNTELAQRLKPINNLRTFLKSATGFDEDLLQMSAGQLMRRISSNVQSNPAIRQALRDLDKATKIKGKTSLDIEALVDFYSKLEKYYPEIVGKNTFKGQIQGALESSGGILDRVTGAIKSVAGQSENVKRKAITDFLDSYFK